MITVTYRSPASLSGVGVSIIKASDLDLFASRWDVISTAPYAPSAWVDPSDNCVHAGQSVAGHKSSGFCTADACY
jgi:hypothetical protein